MDFWNALLRLGTWGKNFEGDFIAGSIAFLISFLISWAISGIDSAVSISSFLGLLAAILPLLLSLDKNYAFLQKQFIQSKFTFPIKIGILSGEINAENKVRPTSSPFTEFDATDWFNQLSLDKNFRVEWIKASEISNEYRVILNPFGEVYPEENKPNLLSLKRIVKYIKNGGVFVNVAGLAFYYMWDGEVEDLTGPLYETYKLDSVPGILEGVAILTDSYILDTWLYNQFGVRTTFFDVSVIDVKPVKDRFFQGLDTVGGETKVQEFRSAMRSESNESLLIPLLKGERSFKAKDRTISVQSYPIAATNYGFGYLVLNGMKLDKARKQDFDKTVEAIKRISQKLNSEGSLT